MCLTIPKKVISAKGNIFVVSPYNSSEKQQVGSVIGVKEGDWVFTQNGIIVNKISKKQAEEIINIFKK